MRALFFGLGGIGQRHLRILKRNFPEIEICAVRQKGRNFEIDDDLKPDYNVDLNKKYNIKTYKAFNEALEFNLDFAVITNPTSLHVSTALDVVKNGIPVFIEKPISNDITGLKELIKLSNKKNIPVMVGYMMRFNPCAQKLKYFIDSDRIGRIFSVSLTINSYLPSWHKYEKYNEFYAGLKALGGGVVLTEIHEIDLLSWYFGKSERIVAFGGKYSKLDLDVEDNACVLIEQKFKEYIFPISINMSFVQPEVYRKMIVFGERGLIEWDIVKSELLVIDKIIKERESFSPIDFQRNNMFIDQMKHFVNCIKDNKQPITSIQNVIDGHLTALTIKKSLESRSIEEVIKI